MGLAASQARLLLLTGRKSDLEFKSENIAEKRMEIANSVEKLLDEKQTQNSSSANSSSPSAGKVIGSIFSNLIPVVGIFSGLFGGSSNSAKETDSSKIDTELAKLQEQDKTLELKSKQVDTQHKAVQTEVESVQKVIEKNIESSFKILG